jgi:hypothetical protein
MSALRYRVRLLPGLLLAGLLVAAQLGAALHAFEHDAGAPQTKVCPTCITVAHLGAGDINGQPPVELPARELSYLAFSAAAVTSVGAHIARQRGPPHHT